MGCTVNKFKTENSFQSNPLRTIKKNQSVQYPCSKFKNNFFLETEKSEI